MKIDVSIPSYRGNDPQTNKQTHKHTNTHTDKQTVPITIHCAAKLSVQCRLKIVCSRWKGKKAIPHIIKMNFLADEVRQTADFHFRVTIFVW